MRRKVKLSGVLSVVLGSASMLLAISCVGVRILNIFPAVSAKIPTENTYSTEENTDNSSESAEREENVQVFYGTENTESTEGTESTETSPASDEVMYPVIESHFGEGAIVYSNFSMKNTTNYTVDFEDLLSRSLSFSISDTHEVQVLIIHTHACERYLLEDTGYYPESYYPRTTDNSKNVTRVGDSIMQSLKEEGIGVVHCEEQYDNPSYNGSYDRSRQSIERYLEKYPNIKVILDIHRDSLGKGGEEGKIKPTFTFNGKKAAQMMIMTGYDSDGSYDFPNWEENLVFALKLQQTAENMFPGMTRPLYFGNFVYNLNVNSGSLLIEIGTDVNTLDEAVYTGELLGKALANVLQNDE